MWAISWPIHIWHACLYSLILPYVLHLNALPLPFYMRLRLGCEDVELTAHSSIEYRSPFWYEDTVSKTLACVLRWLLSSSLVRSFLLKSLILYGSVDILVQTLSCAVVTGSWWKIACMSYFNWWQHSYHSCITAGFICWMFLCCRNKLWHIFAV